MVPEPYIQRHPVFKIPFTTYLQTNKIVVPDYEKDVKYSPVAKKHKEI